MHYILFSGGVVLFTYSCETKLMFTLHGSVGVQHGKHV